MDTHKGKINIAVAKEIIADHYDVYLKKEDSGYKIISEKWVAENQNKDLLSALVRQNCGLMK
jgi:hypothetical protein